MREKTMRVIERDTDAKTQKKNFERPTKTKRKKNEQAHQNFNHSFFV
jgi:hypothetical protein